MTLHAERHTARPATRQQETAGMAPRGGNYVTTSTTTAGSDAEGSYVTAPNGGSANRNRAHGHYVTLANRPADDTAGSYTRSN